MSSLTLLYDLDVRLLSNKTIIRNFIEPVQNRTNTNGINMMIGIPMYLSLTV